MQTPSSVSRTKKEIQEAFDFLIKTEPPIRDDFLKDVAKPLARVRREKGWTQDKLNRRLGVADRLVNKWECGTKTPNGFNLFCWAQALDEILTTAPVTTSRAVFYLEDGSVVERDLTQL